jgi:hypothetical protein
MCGEGNDVMSTLDENKGGGAENKRWRVYQHGAKGHLFLFLAAACFRAPKSLQDTSRFMTDFDVRVVATVRCAQADTLFQKYFKNISKTRSMRATPRHESRC